ncbi:Gfo/Idh/MocA family protein [Nocardioides caeni]|uniref:Gfo/Idh/MocA family oxidoreductase n=1 Tax=Nocardioides caeni TaxID=574700 RepID=A0A4S8N738_9ACTN|nr:Gfo/Idh/MocA family oxidoreductase [Nocardioides caeni]THV12097.1 Gfo/Idh/MocA family oxidoreductase [Nocardioides caeni]
MTSSPAIGWGILAPGGISQAFATDLALVPDARLVHVGSRTPDRAAGFAQRHGAERYGDYAAVLDDPEVEVVYIGSPHVAHAAQVERALAAGKHVLCEKPLTLDRAGAERLFAAARANDRFLMEAMWSACHPVWRDLAARLHAGELGTPRHLAAEFHFTAPADPGHRLLNPALGGGALHDIGIYPLTFAHLMLGEAIELLAVGTVADTHVDLDVAITGRYPDDTLATLTAGLTSQAANRARITTDAGWVEVSCDFHAPHSWTFHPLPGRHQPQEPVVHVPAQPVIGVGYGNEIAHVHDCLRAGLRESPWVPAAQTLAILGQVEDVRAQIGALPHPLGRSL